MSARARIAATTIITGLLSLVCLLSLWVFAAWAIGVLTRWRNERSADVVVDRHGTPIVNVQGSGICYQQPGDLQAMVTAARQVRGMRGGFDARP